MLFVVNIKNSKTLKYHTFYKKHQPFLLLAVSNQLARFLLSVTDIFSKYAWVFPLKDKKGIRITNAFQKILDRSNRKPNKIWVNKGSEFYKRSMKSWLQDNDINNMLIVVLVYLSNFIRLPLT